jgi:thymidylate kinase
MRVLRSWSDPLVIMDRSLWSTLAVHCAENPDRLGKVLGMLQPFAEEIRVPDLTLVLDASFETCQTRIAHKSGEARALDELTAVPDFHWREREFYRWLSRQRPEIMFIDANQFGPGAIAERASALIREKAVRS